MCLVSSNCYVKINVNMQLNLKEPPKDISIYKAKGKGSFDVNYI